MELRIEHENSLTLNNYAAFLREQGRYDEAEPLCRRVSELWGPPDGLHPGVAYAAQNLGAVLLTAQANFHWARVLHARSQSESLELGRESLAVLYNTYGQRHGTIAWAKVQLAGMCLADGSLDEAKRLYRESLQIEHSLSRSMHPNLINANEGLTQIEKKEKLAAGHRVN